MRILEIKKVEDINKEVELILSNENSKASKIRDLFDLGFEIKEISNITGIRYQMCYNNVSNYILKNRIEVVKEERVSKKDIVINMYDNGSSLKDIAFEIRSSYNYVWKIVNEYKLSKEEFKEEVKEVKEDSKKKEVKEVKKKVSKKKVSKKESK